MANEDLTHGAAPGHPPVARAEIPVSGHAAELKFVLPFGVLALIGAVASVATCYATILAYTFLGVSYAREIKSII